MEFKCFKVSKRKGTTKFADVQILSRKSFNQSSITNLINQQRCDKNCACAQYTHKVILYLLSENPNSSLYIILWCKCYIFL